MNELCMLHAELHSELFGGNTSQHVGTAYLLLHLQVYMLVNEYLDGIQPGPETEEMGVSFYLRTVISAQCSCHYKAHSVSYI